MVGTTGHGSPFDRHFDAKLCAVTTYFNSEDYVSRRENYARFMESMSNSGVPCFAVECAFGKNPFVLPRFPAVLRKRADSILWQKERLLNLLIRRLPRSIDKIAWIDADVLFENPKWAQEAACLLDRYAVVQLFESVVRLPRGHTCYQGEGEAWSSFGAEHQKVPGCERKGWFWHGHTGFAWAARRELLEACGLFDLCLTGSADHLMAHAFVGDISSRCIDLMIGIGSPLYGEFTRWAAIASRVSGGRVGFVSGRILHLWHGDLKHRRYYERSQEFKKLHFDPSKDVAQAGSGCWAWTGTNAALEAWAKEFFIARKEDGEKLSS